MKAIACVVSLLLLSALAGAQQHGHHSATPSGRPAPALAGLGELHHPVSTRDAQAQKFFDQGLSLSFAFNHDEAFRAFEQAARLDPDLGMAYWGMALVLGPNINLPVDEERAARAYALSRQALDRSRAATENDRAYIEALAQRYAQDPKADRAALDLAYKNAMGALVKRYPDDLDAATLYAEAAMNLRPWQYWTEGGQPAPGTEEIVAVLESVMRRDPRHAGANHLYIHAVEASPTPERALGAAGRLEGLTPGAGHLVHMPSHIYARLGDQAASARINEKAAMVDKAYIERHGVTGFYPLMYYNHNLQFAAYSHAAAGNYRDAIRMADQVTARVRAVVKEMPMAEFATPTSMLVQIRFRRWAELRKASEPEAHMPYSRVVWHMGRGLSDAAQGRVAAAERELAGLSAAARAMPADLLLGFSNGREIAAIAEHMLAARIAEARDQGAAAIEQLRSAVKKEDALPYDEPPDWYLHARESLGGLYLRNKRPADAERVFREDLERHPRNGRSLFGLAESLKAQGKTWAAAAVEREFAAAWKGADTRLSVADL